GEFHERPPCSASQIEQSPRSWKPPGDHLAIEFQECCPCQMPFFVPGDLPVVGKLPQRSRHARREPPVRNRHAIPFVVYSSRSSGLCPNNLKTERLFGQEGEFSGRMIGGRATKRGLDLRNPVPVK